MASPEVKSSSATGTKKNPACTTSEPGGGKCPGTIVAVEFPKIINGVLYNRYEYCQRCGQVFPG